MTTVHSGYEPGASQASAAGQNSEYIELDTINNIRNEAVNSALFPTPAIGGRPAITTVQPEYAKEAATPRRPSIYDSQIEIHATNLHHDEVGATELEFSLPPVDGGKDAWLFLLSAFVLDILVWGTFRVCTFS